MMQPVHMRVRHDIVGGIEHVFGVALQQIPHDFTRFPQRLGGMVQITRISNRCRKDIEGRLAIIFG